MDARWMGIVGQAEARGGRPAMLLGPDPSRFLVVGVHLQLPGMRLIISDLAGEVLHEEKLFDRSKICFGTLDEHVTEFPRQS